MRWQRPRSSGDFMYTFFLNLSRGMAVLGGIMLCALIVLTCVSVLGRSLNGILHADLVQSFVPDLARGLIDLGIGPVNGDFELVEAGVAFSIFAFLPLCQISGAHAAVDVFTSRFSPRVMRVIRWAIDVIFAVVLVLIAVQLFDGMQSKMRSGQTTLLLEFPVWWAYALSMIGAVMAALVSVYLAIVRTRELVVGSAILPPDLGADH